MKYFQYSNNTFEYLGRYMRKSETVCFVFSWREKEVLIMSHNLYALSMGIMFLNPL